MRTLRLSLAGMVILALLGGLGGAALAQDEEAMPVTATHVTGTKVSESLEEPGESTTDEHGVDNVRGRRNLETWEWSDPRLPTARRGVWNANGYATGADSGVVVWTGAVRLDGPDGAWSGTATVAWDPITWSGFGLDVLVGEGDYEGLTAILECLDRTCDGYIFEVEPPPVPEAPESPAE